MWQLKVILLTEKWYCTLNALFCPFVSGFRASENAFGAHLLYPVISPLSALMV